MPTVLVAWDETEADATAPGVLRKARCQHPLWKGPSKSVDEGANCVHSLGIGRWMTKLPEPQSAL